MLPPACWPHFILAKLMWTKQLIDYDLISYILSAQIWWCNMKWLLSYFKNYIYKFMQVSSRYHKLFHFHLPFYIWKVWKGREKLQKYEYLDNQNSFFDEIKNTFHSFGRAIIWWKNKNLIKNSTHKLYGTSLWVVASFKSHPVCIYAKISVLSLFQFLMTLCEFTEHLPGSNKVCYPISGRSNFTVIKVWGGPSKLYLWKIPSLHYICFSLKISFVNGDKSAGSPQNLQKGSPNSM